MDLSSRECAYKDGTSATVQQGSLLVIDRFGHLVTTLANASLLDGPWDLTVNDQGLFAQVFVSNVLSGTVTRLDVFVDDQFHVIGATQIAHGYTHRTDPAALSLAPRAWRMIQTAVCCTLRLRAITKSSRFHSHARVVRTTARAR